MVYKYLEDGTSIRSTSDPSHCTYNCGGANENGRVYYGARKVSHNLYKCICLSRDLSKIVGSLKGLTASPLDNLYCDDQLKNSFVEKEIIVLNNNDNVM